MNQLNYKHIAEKLKKIKRAYLLSFLFFTASAYYTFELIRTGASKWDESGFVAIYFAIVMIWLPLTLCSLGLNIRYIYKENRRLFSGHSGFEYIECLGAFCRFVLGVGSLYEDLTVGDLGLMTNPTFFGLYIQRY